MTFTERLKEIRPGVRIEFNHRAESLVGVVNGTPTIAFHSDIVTVFIPVHVANGNKNLIVSSHNVTDVFV